MFEQGAPQTSQVEKLSACVETLCCDWQRMRTVVERIARSPWWDLHTLCCRHCHAPFLVSDGTCDHDTDCVYQRCCEILVIDPLPLPDQAVLGEWQKQSSASVAL